MINADDNEYYNTTKYPHYVGQHASKWKMYADDDGIIASIACVQGCRSSRYGSVDHLKSVIRDMPNSDWEMSDYGANLLGEKFMAYWASKKIS